MNPQLEWSIRPRLFRLQYILWRLRGRSGLVPHVQKEKIVREQALKYGLHALVETGTYKGDMIAALRNAFDEIHSIELNPDLHRTAVERFAGAPNIFLHQGDSAEVLPAVVQSLRRPALFWLDGHFSGQFAGVATARTDVDTPVRDELRVIFDGDEPGHVVLIDDAREFTGEGDYPSLAELESIVREYRPQATVTAEDDVIRISPG